MQVLPVQPVDPRDMQSTHDASRFRSFATGYVKRESLICLINSHMLLHTNRLNLLIGVPAMWTLPLRLGRVDVCRYRR